MSAYNEKTAESLLSELDNWNFFKDGIEKEFLFKDFNQALAFIVQLGMLAEKHNHHPELHNIYNRVSVRLTTHDANGVTFKDFDLAKAIDKLF
ncbi:4a-hydroxytetrahydrobiopterin dehydratase [Flavobacterium nitratireducens]|uniref:4a-hydroxytetrahydrobiopterin dehydratase n=1 Tax=Flavobacterium nitratireducens TaxID=992289 RepID=UPI002414D138|nr:4a-hydroxytetrahydrobiopterin dehydratase [Flavobacterium nitratireducens]